VFVFFALEMTSSDIAELACSAPWLIAAETSVGVKYLRITRSVLVSFESHISVYFSVLEYAKPEDN
jgi:hypothetical protein